MVSCEATDFKFPMLADVYYPRSEQGPYGGLVQTWILDQTIAGNFIRAGAETKEELVINVDLTQESLIIGRVRKDLRISEREDNNALTNIIIANIRNSEGDLIYSETSGPRANSSTIYEVATQQPFVNPFGKIEHYRLVLRRAENQGALG